jgi:uncharacterized protein YegP (UPF0339 family)
MKVIIYEDLRGEWRWRLVAANGRIVADSSEGYVDATNVRDAVEKITAAFEDGITIEG